MFPIAILSQEYGLNFKGQSYLLDERTGLEISPNEYIKVKNEFEVSFGFLFQQFSPSILL